MQAARALFGDHHGIREYPDLAVSPSQIEEVDIEGKSHLIACDRPTSVTLGDRQAEELETISYGATPLSSSGAPSMFKPERQHVPKRCDSLAMQHAA